MTGGEVSGANHLVQIMLKRELPGFPRIFIPVVDVRDVAAAHVLAVEVPRRRGSASCSRAARSCR